MLTEHNGRREHSSRHNETRTMFTGNTSRVNSSLADFELTSTESEEDSS